MAEMPHFSTVAEGNPVVNIRALVYVGCVYHPKGCLVIGYFAMG